MERTARTESECAIWQVYKGSKVGEQQVQKSLRSIQCSQCIEIALTSGQKPCKSPAGVAPTPYVSVTSHLAFKTQLSCLSQQSALADLTSEGLLSLFSTLTRCAVHGSNTVAGAHNGDSPFLVLSVPPLGQQCPLCVNVTPAREKVPGSQEVLQGDPK